MSGNAAVDADALRAEVRSKYREVAIDAHGTYHFHTGRGLAARLGYDDEVVSSLPDCGSGVICRCRKSVLAAIARKR